MAPAPVKAGQKRKVASGNTKDDRSSGVRKRQKFQDARAIPVQRPDAVISASGELNISSFIKAREFEIGALERSMQKAKTSLSTRAFQQVPRHLRRRTASHNAKKVPRRLRRRAEREVGFFFPRHTMLCTDRS
jgi:ribonuclease P/MRP protein subunit POP1